MARQISKSDFDKMYLELTLNRGHVETDPSVIWGIFEAGCEVFTDIVQSFYDVTPDEETLTLAEKIEAKLNGLQALIGGWN